MTFNGTIDKHPQRMRNRPEQIFVHREKFCELLLSYKKLVRSDEPSNRIRGLLDVESGERFVIRQEDLFARCR